MPPGAPAAVPPVPARARVPAGPAPARQTPAAVPAWRGRRRFLHGDGHRRLDGLRRWRRRSGSDGLLCFLHRCRGGCRRAGHDRARAGTRPLIGRRPDAHGQRNDQCHNANHEDRRQRATDEQERLATLLGSNRLDVGLRPVIVASCRPAPTACPQRRGRIRIARCGAVGILRVGQADGGGLESRRVGRGQRGAAGQRQFGFLGRVDRAG